MIRTPTQSDIEGLVEVHVAAWRVAYQGIMPGHVLENISLDERRANWIRALEDTDRNNLIYEEAGRVLGFASYGPTRDEDGDSANTAELIGLYVHPEAWRRGIGRALLLQSESKMEVEFAEETLWVIRDNARAKHFYTAVGFVEEAGKQRLLPWYDCELYEQRYRKRLPGNRT